MYKKIPDPNPDFWDIEPMHTCNMCGDCADYNEKYNDYLCDCCAEYLDVLEGEITND